MKLTAKCLTCKHATAKGCAALKRGLCKGGSLYTKRGE
jgi:hypothetical protein